MEAINNEDNAKTKIDYIPINTNNEATDFLFLDTDHRQNTIIRDLRVFFTGEEGNRRTRPFRGRPVLAREFLSAALDRIAGRSKLTETSIKNALRTFYVFLDELESQTRAAVTAKLIIEENTLHNDAVDDKKGRLDALYHFNSIADLPYDTFFLFANYLRHKAGNSSRMAMCYHYVWDIISVARKSAGLPPFTDHVLRTDSKDATPRIHREVSPRAAKHLKAASLRMLRSMERSPLSRFVAPDGINASSISPLAWSDCSGGRLSCGELAAVVKWAIERKVHANESITDSIPDNNVWQGGKYPTRKRQAESGCDSQSVASYTEIFLPSCNEALAAWTAIAYQTGWIDTLRAVDLEGSWFMAETAHNSYRYLIFATRPKTGGFMSVRSQGGANSPLGILKRRAERTAFIRRLATEAANQMAGRELSANEQIEHARLKAVARSPFAYLDPKQNGTSCLRHLSKAADNTWPRFKAAALSALPCTPDVAEEISSITQSDFRDDFARRVMDRTGGNLYALQAALGHRNVTVTAQYIRQHDQLVEAFRKFAVAVGVIVDEVVEHGEIDLAALILRVFPGRDRGRLSPELRARLVSSWAGIKCSNPKAPPAIIDPTPVAGQCTTRRCWACPRGFIFPDEPGALETFAERRGMLRAYESVTPLSRWIGSQFHIEAILIEAIRDEYFSGRIGEFEAIAEKTYMLTAKGELGGISPIRRFAPKPGSQ